MNKAPSWSGSSKLGTTRALITKQKSHQMPSPELVYVDPEPAFITLHKEIRNLFLKVAKYLASFLKFLNGDSLSIPCSPILEKLLHLWKWQTDQYHNDLNGNKVMSFTTMLQSTLTTYARANMGRDVAKWLHNHLVIQKKSTAQGYTTQDWIERWTTHKQITIDRFLQQANAKQIKIENGAVFIYGQYSCELLKKNHLFIYVLEIQWQKQSEKYNETEIFHPLVSTQALERLKLGVRDFILVFHMGVRGQVLGLSSAGDDGFFFLLLFLFLSFSLLFLLFLLRFTNLIQRKIRKRDRELRSTFSLSKCHAGYS